MKHNRKPLLIRSGNIRYGKAFRLPRKIFKHFLSLIAYPVVTKFYEMPQVRSIDETLHILNHSNKSISRFGDGELLYIIDKLNLPFQYYDPRLATILKKALVSTNENILIGLPVGYDNINELNPEAKKTWRSQVAWIYPRLRKYLLKHKVYHSTSITRPYIVYKNKENAARWFSKLKNLWHEKDVLIVEGNKSRLGVGNDLFDNARSIKRILGPAHHAFTYYEDIKGAIRKYAEDKLVLIAMGPTATALAYELAEEGIRCLDIGNVDIEYEWFLRKSEDKIKIPGKYTSEAPGGRTVEDIHDEKYHSQIIKSI